MQNPAHVIHETFNNLLLVSNGSCDDEEGTAARSSFIEQPSSIKVLKHCLHVTFGCNLSVDADSYLHHCSGL